MVEYDPTVWREFSGTNLAYLQDLYERFQTDPAAVDPETRQLFERSGPPPTPSGAPAPASYRPAAPAQSLEPLLIAGAVSLATAIRAFGHRAARLNPLGGDPPGDVTLRPEAHGIVEDDLAGVPASVVGGAAAENAGNALTAIRKLRQVYEGASGYEFEHVSNSDERAWLRAAVESGQFRPPRDPINERKLLERLTQVGAFERFLHVAFPSQTRFSLEGLGIMVPVLDEIIGAAAEVGTRGMVVGMAHRGRLNVLAHALCKPYDQIIAEFMGHFKRSNVSSSDSSDPGWTGDVKYHLGARNAYKGGQQVEMIVSLVPNPSHLEWVNPVVEGITRASDEQRDLPGPARQDETASLAVLIHGDAAFPGQGIVAETLNLSRLPGYRTGGTIHIIANNQIGFTTTGVDARSTQYASDLAKGFEIPIIHVNGDHPEDCIAAARLAHAYRHKFHKDVLIDLIGYRRWGHNEGDEPAFTQPQLYARIKDHPTVRERWAQDMIGRGLIDEAETKQMLQAAIENLQSIRRSIQAKNLAEDMNGRPTSGFEAGGITGGLGHQGAASVIETAVPRETLAELNAHLYRVPEGFRLSSKLDKPYARRRTCFDAGAEDPRIEWAHAEALAFGAILADGTPIRLTGQDVQRGTFSQRHAVWHDAGEAKTYVPLQTLPQARASFEIWNSPLSEQATLGFEFGYSSQAVEALNLWEAQYGDFINVPQAIIDEFIATAKSKWDQVSAMVLLLPHGYEGAGPDHSSARLERFLQLVAEDNLRVANCSTAAQYFHILRRQAQLLSKDPRPLVLLTPKSLLRNPKAASLPEELTNGRFCPVLPPAVPAERAADIKRLIFCSGKVYYDLLGAPADSRINADQVAIARVEELYPFPADEVARVLETYPNLSEVAWLQEEPREMGAWTFVAPRLRDILAGRLPLRYIGRTRRASPAEGSYEWHAREQARLVEAAFHLTPVEESEIREVAHAE